MHFVQVNLQSYLTSQVNQYIVRKGDRPPSKSDALEETFVTQTKELGNEPQTPRCSVNQISDQIMRPGCRDNPWLGNKFGGDTSYLHKLSP